MGSDPTGAKVWFDPIGLRIEPGQTVRWVLHANVHTSTAYHPDNDGHPLRIPEAAEHWDSGYLIDPGAHFDVTLAVEGVYGYFCAPHAEAGQIGRASCRGRVCQSVWISGCAGIIQKKLHKLTRMTRANNNH